MLGHPVGRQLGVDLVVHQHGRALVAHAHAVGPFQAEGAVGRRLAEVDAQIARELPGDLFLAGQLARVGAAEPEDEAPLGLRVEEGVEGRDRVDFHRMAAEHVGDDLHRLAVDAPVFLLDRAKDGDEGGAVVVGERRDFHHVFAQLFVVGHRRHAPFAASRPSTLAISTAGSTGFSTNSSTGTISSSLPMLRPMARLTLVSMRMGRA